jgi:hypothetical protein
MTTMKAVLVGTILAANLASPVLAAADDACLQNNRIWGWQAVDDRTLLVTDRTYKRYTVHLTGGCVGLKTYAAATMAFATKTNLGCLSQGDKISFSMPGIGPLSCFVTTVDAGVPSTPPPAK